MSCPACGAFSTGRCDTIPTPRPKVRSRERHISVELALYQPDFAHNAGAALRLGACLGVRVHIIHPTGFPFSLKALRRGGLDYVERADFQEHVEFAAFESWRRAAGRRLVLLTTGAETAVHAACYAAGDILMLGRETAGVPPPVAAAADQRVRIPMRPGLRSLNMATAATLVLGEALRQTGGLAGLT